MKPFDIYNASQQFNDCKDDRPWLIIDVRPGEMYGCFPIATEHYGDPNYPIESGHPDFPATGLSKSCHILDARIFEIHHSQFGRRRGMLTNQLLASFKEYSGLDST